MHKTKFLKPILFMVLSSILASCTSYGTKFFIRNYEPSTVDVQYKYFQKGQYSDSSGFDYKPKTYVLVSREILKPKILKNYPFYRTKTLFDTLRINGADDVYYKFAIPSKSTVSISPVYKYGASIEYLILNDRDTILFTEKYPKVLNTSLIDNKIVKYRMSIIGNSYYLVDLKLHEFGY